MRREAFARRPLHGNVLEALLDGRLRSAPTRSSSPTCGSRCPTTRRSASARGRSSTSPSWSRRWSAWRSARTACSPTAASSPTPTTASTTPTRRSPGRASRRKGPTRIGDNVWLGANVVVTSGVTIGERCVIGANSVVTQDIPPFSIAAGAPAKVLRAVTYDGGDGARATADAAAFGSAAEARAQRHHVVDVAPRVVEQPARADRGEALVVAGRRHAARRRRSPAAAGRGTASPRARCRRPRAGRAGRARGCG